MSLQRKLLLISLVTVLLPLTGWMYLRQMDRALRQAQEQALVATAELLARTVNSWVRLPPQSAWHVQQATTAPVVDGWADDWSLLQPNAEPVPGGGRLLLARHAGDLYLLFALDARELTPQPRALRLALGMHGARCDYRLDITAPGMVAAAPAAPARPVCFDPLRAQWQRDADGGRLELRIPGAARLGLLGLTLEPATGTVTDAPPALRPLQRRAPELTQRLAFLLPENRRVRVLDRDGWVVAMAGHLGQGDDEGAGRLSGAVYGALVAQHLGGSAALEHPAARVDAVEAWQALSGVPATSWRRSVALGRVTLTAAVPLPGAGEPRGALLLEQSTRAMPLPTHRGLLWLLLGGLTLLLATGIWLASFALRLSRRLHRLRDAAQQAAARPGQDVAATRMPETGARDELGELARGYQQLLTAVAGYTGHLHSLAPRLAHDLSTPLALVRRSLRALEDGTLTPAQTRELRHASEGTTRLGELVRAMGALSRVEQQLEHTPPERFDLRLVVAGCAEGYRLLAGERELALELPAAPLPLVGVPTLVVRALDKLFDNAISFAPEDGWLRLSLRALEDGAVIEMANEGPPLPDGDAAGLFDSLVSRREPGAGGDKQHLGLGLSVVRLVAERHGGHVSAENITGGVAFSLCLRGISAAPDAGG